jgi:hypothetical protein
MAHDVTKLPKWARDYIGTLERGFADAHKRLAQFEGREATNTFIEDYPNDKPLPNNSEILFKLTDRFHITARIGTDHYGNPALVIYGRDGLVVQPSAANHIYLRASR